MDLLAKQCGSCSGDITDLESRVEANYNQTLAILNQLVANDSAQYQLINALTVKVSALQNNDTSNDYDRRDILNEISALNSKLCTQFEHFTNIILGLEKKLENYQRSKPHLNYYQCSVDDGYNEEDNMYQDFQNMHPDNDNNVSDENQLEGDPSFAVSRMPHYTTFESSGYDFNGDDIKDVSASDGDDNMYQDFQNMHPDNDNNVSDENQLEGDPSFAVSRMPHYTTFEISIQFQVKIPT
jgi:hypothetical protein